MSDRLAVRIDPIKLANSGDRLTGWVPITQMPRLCDLLTNSEGRVEATIQFGQIDQGTRFITGEAEAVVSVVCQRCLEEMTFNLRAEFSLGLVETESEAQTLPEEFEPKLIGDEMLEIAEMLEDELILAMPIISMHDEADCRCEALKYCAPADIKPETIADSNTRRPMAGLKALLDKKTGDDN